MEKKRVFWSQDHNQDAQIIQATNFLSPQDRVDVNQSPIKEEFLRQHHKARTLLMTQSDHLKSEYEPVQDDQFPSPDGSIASWLMKNQTKAMASEQMRFMDFQAPIEMEALIVPGAIT